MLISKRRLRWSAITLLIVCLLLLLRPTRAWVDRWAVARLVGPQISVGELYFHSSRSLVEVRDLRWSGNDSQRRFQLAARRGWFAYDKLGLIDRHTRLPKVILQEANLHLEPLPKASASQVEVWKQHLARRITQFDWDQLREQFSCLVATQELKSKWNANVARWVSRSQQILSEAERLERQTIQMDNPLRFELSLQEKLNSLQKLANEQTLLTKQIDDLSNALESEAVRLQELHRTDRLKFAGLVIGNSATDGLLVDREQMCQELVLDLGRLFWQQISCYGEIVNQLVTATQDVERPSYDVDVRSNRHGNEWLRLTDWRASGQFSCGVVTAPYQASGNWSLTQEPLCPSNLELSWEATFQRENGQIGVQVEHSSVQSAATRWVLLQGPSLANQADTASAPTDSPTLGSRSRVEVTSYHGRLQGSLALSPVSLAWLAWEAKQQMPASRSIGALAAIHAEALDNHLAQAEPVHFAIDGQWTQAELQLNGTIPTWVSQTVSTALDKRVQLASEASKLRLDQEFNTELSQLQQLVSAALADSKSLTAAHGQQLLAVQDRLQRQLAEMNGIGFARRPGAITR